MVRVQVSPELLGWASDRSGVGEAELARRFPSLEQWLVGATRPTLKQLEEFARVTYTPIGFLFMKKPPVERLPIPDFRTVADEALRRPTANLLDTLYLCQERQDWYRDYARANREAPLPFVGSLTVETPVALAAERLRGVLSFDVEDRGSSWTEAFTRLRDQADECGVLVMVSGVVGSNTHRKLNPNEFRGFALADRLGPLVFVNGADTKAAQIFTLAHELAHIWLGGSVLDDPSLAGPTGNESERWCNKVAAEFLVPLDVLEGLLRPNTPIATELDRLAKAFKVSTLVVLRRVFEANLLRWDEYQQLYRSELARVLELVERGHGDGGNFYNTQPVRVSKRFARALIESTLEGQTLHRDAFQMLGFKKYSTFTELAHRLGVL